MARSMLRVHNTPYFLWPDAMMAACYIKNKLPHTALKMKIPIELWSKRDTNLAHLRTMFCLAYVRIAKSKFKKLEDCSFPAIFAEYSTEKKAWRFYSLDLSQVIFSRDAKFIENRPPQLQPNFVYSKDKFILIEKDESDNQIDAQNLYNEPGITVVDDQDQIENNIGDEDVTVNNEAIEEVTCSSDNNVTRELLDSQQEMNESEPEDQDAPAEQVPTGSQSTQQKADDIQMETVKNDKALRKLQRQLQIDMMDQNDKIQLEDVIGIGQRVSRSRRAQSHDGDRLNLLDVSPFEVDTGDQDVFYDAPEDTMGERTTEFPVSTLQELDREFTDPQSYDAAMQLPSACLWEEAIEEEMNSQAENGTFQLIDKSELPKGEQLLSSKFVFKYKTGPTGQLERRKVRWCIRGFLQDIDWATIFAPVVKYCTIRFLLVLTVLLSWRLCQFDVKTAFLNAKLNTPVYTSLPKGFKCGNNKSLIMKLLKSVYGLKEAPKLRHDLLKESLKSIGFSDLHSDTSLFTLKKNGKINIIV
ncbi:hypothetical protein MIR68_003961 [Amoeboaphelidium protococcarum]|nr:hypothetical protein MIR68_003961 [Amoeboaphelidium protococcarum]